MQLGGPKEAWPLKASFIWIFFYKCWRTLQFTLRQSLIFSIHPLSLVRSSSLMV